MSDSDEVRTVAVADWHTAVESARESGHTFFDWLTAVDQTDRAESPGFDVTIRLLDVSTPGRLHGIRLTTAVPDGASLASVTDLFRGAAWHERETHEMFGLQFGGFVDHTGDPGLGLRPLLLPEGFDGTPLRKSFQLAARASKPWPGGKEPGEGHDSVKSPSRRRVQAPGVPPPEWGPR
ncbi:MAG TPA: NADH-quinone oxidoreductase subunit C [Phycicoccus sp.]|nr:NADH-quinone oxidoreductase subunit C [Phycicoccus sp.]